MHVETYMQTLAPMDWISRFRALGDETRLGLLCALLSEELSVGELSDVVQAAQPGEGRSLLRSAGGQLGRAPRSASRPGGGPVGARAPHPARRKGRRHRNG